MYTMTINSNNSTKTYRTLTAAQEAAENVIFAGLILIDGRLVKRALGRRAGA